MREKPEKTEAEKSAAAEKGEASAAVPNPGGREKKKKEMPKEKKTDAPDRG